MDKHVVTVTERVEDCGAVFADIVCSCGYSGTQTERPGCWQQGHDVIQTVDPEHWNLACTAIDAQADAIAMRT